MSRPLTPTTIAHEHAREHADLYDLATNTSPWPYTQDDEELDQLEDLATQQQLLKQRGVVESR